MLSNVVTLSDVSKEIRYGLTTSAEASGTHRFIRITDIDDNGYLKTEGEILLPIEIL